MAWFVIRMSWEGICVSSNADKIYKQYAGQPEDKRDARSRHDWLEFHYTKQHLEGLITKEDRILEIGCATGYYGWYYADRCREYVGVDLFPAHIARFRQEIEEQGLSHLSCEIGDATHLDCLSDGSFDAVLSLGPMYHLPTEEREAAFAESARVCKTGGVLAFAYIVPLGTYAGACVREDLRQLYPNAQANDYVLNRGTDDVQPDLFHFVMPEEMEEAAKRHGLSKIKNLGTNFDFAMKVVNDMTDEQFALMRPLYDRMANCESCTGLAGHALLVCRKD